MSSTAVWRGPLNRTTRLSAMTILLSIDGMDHALRPMAAREDELRRRDSAHLLPRRRFCRHTATRHRRWTMVEPWDHADVCLSSKGRPAPEPLPGERPLACAAGAGPTAVAGPCPLRTTAVGGMREQGCYDGVTPVEGS